MEKINLFCFPYAGGSSNYYRKWKNKIGANIEIIPIEYPGRGTRFSESFSNDMDELIDDLFNQIKQNLEVPYAFFGHSMGAVVAFELAHLINNTEIDMPKKIFLSGRNAPSKVREHSIHMLPDEKFLEELDILGGDVQPLLDYPEVKHVYLPIIRADLKILENYRFDNKPPINIPFTILAGTQDRFATPANMDGWRSFTGNDLQVFEYNGGHFFIDEYQDQVVNLITNSLSNQKVIKTI